MVSKNDKIRELTKRILVARLRLLSNNGFYGMLLMRLGLALDDSLDTAATDGRKIFFSPKFIDEISDSELDFVLMHEVLHVALQHGARQGNRNQLIFNIACDIVVNSNIKYSCGGDESAITIKKYGGAFMHKAPDGKEGYLYTAEQVYKMLLDNAEKADVSGQWDDHSCLPQKGEDDGALSEEWKNYVKQAVEVMKNQQKNGRCGNIPFMVERLVSEFTKPRIDWRSVLTEFVHEEILDYTFSPPDRRYGDMPFFLPELNVAEEFESPKNILFMADTSGSISEKQLMQAYSEIKGAIDQFDGRLQGLIGFFDAAVVPPLPFSSVEELKSIIPKGGGGTNFHAVFDYVRENMKDGPPKSIIILTDGLADFPKEKAAMGIPVLWVINNKSVIPPWGKCVSLEN